MLLVDRGALVELAGVLMRPVQLLRQDSGRIGRANEVQIVDYVVVRRCRARRGHGRCLGRLERELACVYRVALLLLDCKCTVFGAHDGAFSFLVGTRAFNC